MNGPRDPKEEERKQEEAQETKENKDETVEFDDDLYYPAWLDEIDYDFEDDLRD